MSDSFTHKVITVTIEPGTGQMGATPGTPIKLEGLKVHANIHSYNGSAQGELNLTVYGLPLHMINELTTVGPIAVEKKNNRVTVEAGDDNGVNMIYQGSIWTAYGDFQSAPDVAFNVIAYSAYFESIKSTLPNNFPQYVDVADMMQTFATSQGWAFNPNGVSVLMPDRTYNGTIVDQIAQCAEHAKLFFSIDRGVLSVWYKNGGHIQDDAISISPENGMRGYPAFSSNGIMVETLFNPAIKQGGRVNITSSLGVANGTWIVQQVTHDISSETINGPWFTTVAGYPVTTT